MELSRGAKRALVGTNLGAAAAIAFYVVTAPGLVGGPSGRTGPGIVLGILGTFAMLNAAAYSWRRRFVARASRAIAMTAEERRDLLGRERKALGELETLRKALLRSPNADARALTREAKAILKKHGVGRTIRAQAEGGRGRAVRLVIQRREWGGRLRAWYLAHLSAGTLALLLILLHAGFRFGNVIATLAFLCLAGVVVSGFLGLYLYWTVPPKLTVIEDRAERTPEELRDELREVLAELEGLIAGKSEKFLTVYQQEAAIPGIEMKPNLRWVLERESVERDTARPDRLRLVVKEIPPSEQEEFRKVIRLIFQKEKIEVSLYPQLRYDYLLKVWLSTHIPLSAAMWGFAVVHILSVLYY